MARELQSILSGKKAANGFSVNPCSCCEEIRVTLGNRRLGGIRWCRDCVKLSFGWAQFNESTREALMNAFDRVEAMPEAQKLLAKVVNVDDDLKKAYSIGEARLRVIQADLEESRG